MARFKIVTTAGPAPGADYSLEMESLAGIGAEIVEVKGGEDELVAAAVDADAIYGKVRPRITARVIKAASKLKVVSLATVGVDSVDVDAATALGIPVTNCPDTFIEEVADHTMMLIHLGNADLACLNWPLLHLKRFHQHRHHHGLVLVPPVLAARVLKLCQTQRQGITPIRLLD